jgi:hypothetical protein
MESVAELILSSNQGGACGAAGPASAPASGLGEAGRRTPGQTRRGPQIKMALTTRRPVAAQPSSSAIRCPAPGRRRYGLRGGGNLAGSARH